MVRVVKTKLNWNIKTASVYIPSSMTQDSTFPFPRGTKEVIVEISKAGDALIIRGIEGSSERAKGK